MAALQRLGSGDPAPTPDTGSLREDVLALLRFGASGLDGLFGEAARGLMAENLTNPERTARLRANMFTDRNKRMREILQRAAARGQIPASAIKPHLIGFAPALVDYHFLVYGAPIPDELLTGIVDDILLPVLTAPPKAAATPG